MAMLAIAALLGVASATLTFTHEGSTWTIHVHDNDLHVTADCPEDSWCGFGFNENGPTMDGAEAWRSSVASFGVPLASSPRMCSPLDTMLALICRTAHRATAVAAGAGLHVDAGPPAAVDADAGLPADVEHAVCASPSPSKSLRGSVALGLVVSRAPRNPYVPRTRDLKVQLPQASAPGAPKKLDKVGGVVGIAMNSVLFVNEHPGDWGCVSVCMLWDR